MGKRTGCAVLTCNAAHYCRGYCQHHYGKARREGLIENISTRGLHPMEIFKRYTIHSPGGCWRWVGTVSSNGYGAVQIDRKRILAHRLAHTLFIGPIPDGLHIDHLCRNRACVNPQHLQAVTCRENVMRGISPSARNSQKTHCPNGHEYAGDNLKISPSGSRVCRICRNAAHVAWAKRQRLAAP